MTNVIEVIIRGKDELSPVVDKTSGGLDKLASVAQGALKFGLAAATTAASGLAAGLAFSISEAIEAEEVQAQLGAVLESTGGVAGVTAEMANDLAAEFMGLTRFTDEAVLSAENVLLTFTNIKDDIFPDATAIVLDMAQALGLDLQQASIQVGKALNDPILGVSALRRVGVNFTEAQGDVIRKLVETGQAAEAQRMILAELNTEFGGSAVAAGETFAGQLDILKNQLSNVAEEIGTALLPELTEVVQDIGPEMVELFADLAESAIPAAIEALADFVVLMTEGIRTGHTLLTWEENIAAAIEEHEQALITAGTEYGTYKAEMERAADVAGVLAADQETLNTLMLQGQLSASMYEQAVVIMTDEQYSAALAAAAHAAELEEMTLNALAADDALAGHIALLQASTEETTAAAEATASLDDQFDRITFMLNDPLGNAYEDFIEKNEDLQLKITDLRGEIGELEAKAYLTAEQKEQLENLRGELAQQEQAVLDLAATHEEATSRILFGILQQELATDGWTQEELRLLGEVGSRWGLLSDEAGQTFDDFGAAMDAWREGESLAETINALDDLKRRTSGIGGNYDINFRISVTGDAIPSLPVSGGGQQAIPLQHGAHFIVPPGYDNDQYGPIFVSSGEEVIVRTPAQRAIHNYNLTINTAAPYEPIMDDFAMMKALAGR